MNQTLLKPLLFGLLALTVLLLSTAFLLGERPFAIPVILMIGGVWGVLLWRNGRRPASWPMLLLLLLTALANVPLPGFLTPVPLLWRYLAVIAMLLLWDLSRFQHRLQDLPHDVAMQPLFIAHLQQLGLLVLLALAALAVQQWLPLAFDFDLALISGLLLIFGLNALLRRLQAEPT